MNEEKIIELESKNNELEDRISMLEFKIQLLSENTNTSRLLFEYNMTNLQYKRLMDLMDGFRKEIDSKNEVYHGTFEQKVYAITGKEGDYHFCESLAQSFMEDGRWEEVFPALYGDMKKYEYYMEKRKKGEE